MYLLYAPRTHNYQPYYETCWSSQYSLPTTTRFPQQKIMWNPINIICGWYHQKHECTKTDRHSHNGFLQAFDKVSHSLLLHKLEHYGIRGNINSWIASFLYNRTQAVVVDGKSSTHIDVESGVPQESVLGPSLFLLYINDMPEGIKSTVRLFADDSIAYLTISSDKDSNDLQNDLDKLALWETKWKMSFHPDKCNVLNHQ